MEISPIVHLLLILTGAAWGITRMFPREWYQLKCKCVLFVKRSALIAWNVLGPR
jgi:hypothetical protein